jgi:pyridoxal phosphate-dependent aminotransferase EpsN
MSRIHLSKPHMGEKELEYVREAFASNWMSTVGPHLDAFERELEAVIGRPAVALTSGTAALHLGLRLLGVGPGDEVLCPTLTFVASANPIVYLGATPVFVDSERASWNIDPNLVEDALRARRARPPRAIIVVHLYGQPAELQSLMQLSARYGVPLIEDAAPAMGTLYRGRQVGAFGRVGIVSFNGNKIITTTGGGALVAEESALVDKARHWATQAKDPGVSYEHSELGYNYRMSNVLAGIGRGQLEVLEERVQARRAVADRYVAALSDIEALTIQPEAPWGRHTRWLSCFLVDRAHAGGRNALIKALGSANIEARPVWKPMHLQSLFAGAPRIGGDVAEDFYRRGICLPSSSNLTLPEQERVASTLREAWLSGAAPGAGTD